MLPMAAAIYLAKSACNAATSVPGTTSPNWCAQVICMTKRACCHLVIIRLARPQSISAQILALYAVFMETRQINVCRES